MEYKKNCFTCEFGFDNLDYRELRLNEGETEYKIRCAGSNKLYGKFVPINYCCKYWSKSFDN